MMTKEEYKKNIVRMFDSIRSSKKGEESCIGVMCENCPLNELECYAGDAMFRAYEAIDIIEVVEKWTREHPIVTNSDKYKAESEV